MTPPTASSAYSVLRDTLRAHPRTWLVTGAAGFIGSNLVEELVGLGQHVAGLDNFSTGHRRNLDLVAEATRDATGDFRFIEGDIRDIDACSVACAARWTGRALKPGVSHLTTHTR